MFKNLFKSKASPAAPSVQAPVEQPAASAYQGLLGRTRQAFMSTLFGSAESAAATDETHFDEEALENLEEQLIQADVGMDLALSLVDDLRKLPAPRTRSAIVDTLRQAFNEVLGPLSTTLMVNPNGLSIYLIVGVNGSGKTTLIGKLANRFGKQGKKVVLAAGDTFRAAAEAQIEVWAQRAGATLVRKDNAPASAVVYESLHQAVQTGADVLIIDTAGRLQNQINLMEELKKLRGLIDREIGTLGINPTLEALLVVDATMGQNAMRQVELFKQSVELTGVALTKLDGSAKGGIVLNIAQTHKLPVKLVGTGEGIDNIMNFDNTAFIEALLP